MLYQQFSFSEIFIILIIIISQERYSENKKYYFKLLNFSMILNYNFRYLQQIKDLKNYKQNILFLSYNMFQYIYINQQMSYIYIHTFFQSLYQLIFLIII
ncbi:hypothetical protein PPERSA_12131 [Pseudocohnilembus persalinus]|uniref:Uncharacterized protein n=1 Tax=Pseudocohnilembus persalinus TaxID=266149 RepID=A0A0V0QNU0_PSEPJ|nr:hypothetical protein PPERSA_12131 [Pseudocohnilembus persalinus]|eukprot:KRX03926.1 hypothetical protein PPERSA_12131 [Pseudocohnilembus persalinus]